MKKFKIVVFSLSLVVLSAFTTVFAQDLKASWLEYQSARHTLHDSYAQLDDVWTGINQYTPDWENRAQAIYAQATNSWDLIESSWAQVDAARIVVANTLKIHLSDSSARGSRPAAISIIGPVRTSVKPWTPEPTWGSWEELNHAWASLDQAWVSSSSAWDEVTAASRIYSRTIGEISQYAYSANAEWEKLNAAWAEIDAAWASKQ